MCARIHTNTHVRTPRCWSLPSRSPVRTPRCWSLPSGSPQLGGAGGCTQTSSVQCAECRDGPPLVISPAAPPPAPHPKPPHCHLSLGWLIQPLPPPDALQSLPSTYTQSAQLKHTSDPADSPPKSWDGHPVLLQCGSPSSPRSLAPAPSGLALPTPNPFLPQDLCLVSSSTWNPLPTALDVSVTRSFKSQLRYGEILSGEMMVAFFFFWSSINRPHLSHSTHLRVEWGRVGCL